MTRLALLSDIHGNLTALEAVIADLRQFSLDNVIVAGDSINWGPQSAEVTERLLDLRWPVIRGNNELYLLDYDTGRAPESWGAYTMPPWLHAQMRDLLPVIAAWPDTLQLRFRDAPLVRVYHGFPDNPFDTYHPLMSDAETADLLAPVAEDYLFSAHSHLAMTRSVGRWTIFNSGSVGNPLDGDLRASYMLLDGDSTGWSATLRSVAYDVQSVVQAFERQGFVEQVGSIGRLVVEEYYTGRIELFAFKAWVREIYPGLITHDSQVTDTLIDEFLMLSPDLRERYLPPQYWEANVSPRP